MPKKFNKKFNKKKNFSKYKKYRKRSMPSAFSYGLSINKVGLPGRFPMALTYTTSLTRQSVLGVPFIHVFAMNSLFDPDVTFTGHQPMYFDQISALYEKYTVYKMDIQVMAIPLTSAPWMLGILPSQANNVSTLTSDEFKEQKGAYYKVIAGNTNKTIIKRSYNISTMLGKTNSAILNDNVYLTSVGSNPTDILYNTLYAQTLDSSTADIIIEVKIKYHAIFTQLKLQATS